MAKNTKVTYRSGGSLEKKDSEIWRDNNRSAPRDMPDKAPYRLPVRQRCVKLEQAS